jgi:catechol 2,3-dioxygenase-like lactoylglutathione lyase family enzyme
MDDARIFHVNVNCSNLERSRGFYADALGLDPSVRTNPDASQPGDAFGLARARWDAWILVGARGFDGGAIDLLEWREPLPTGTPPGSLVERGYQRVGIAVADLDAALAQVAMIGGEMWSEPISHSRPGGEHVRLVMTSDPDGTTVELIEGTGPRVASVAVCCEDLEYSLAFYRALGFEERARFGSDNADGRHLRIDGPVALDEIVLAAPAGGDVGLVLVGWRVPTHRTAPSERPANTLGIWRTALLVSDLDAACAQLAALRIPTLSPIVAMAMGEGLPRLRFVCFRGPDGEVIELIEQPR